LVRLVVVATLVLPATLRAQAATADAGAQAVVAVFHADPVPGATSLTELKLVQPLIMVHAALPAAHLRFIGTLDLEGLTMPNGELAPGDWGEGFVDRRHPHTYAHELLLVADDLLGARSLSRLSLTAGKGFAPFGTDDPMSRPFVRFPVNHHLAQILERWVGIAAWGTGPVTVEAGLFDGDEPERPGQWPRFSGRFGDSWSARGTLRPLAGLELQGSHASVASPEHRPGAGLTQRKWDLSARLSRPVAGHAAYALIEWARTGEADGFFHFSSLLAEVAWSPGPHRASYRIERTTRPEEERLLDPFRSERPHLDNQIFGTTRWTVHTFGYALSLPLRALPLAIAPLAELSAGRVTRIEGLFDPESFYGRTTFWALTIGARITFGMPMHRMGRYGAALPARSAMHPHQLSGLDGGTAGSRDGGKVAESLPVIPPSRPPVL
jgi:hypothetical protein